MTEESSELMAAIQRHILSPQPGQDTMQARMAAEIWVQRQDLIRSIRAALVQMESARSGHPEDENDLKEALTDAAIDLLATILVGACARRLNETMKRAMGLL